MPVFPRETQAGPRAPNLEPEEEVKGPFSAPESDMESTEGLMHEVAHEIQTAVHYCTLWLAVMIH